MTIDEAKRSVRILDLAREAGYKITKAGANEYKILCPNPAHEDSDASCYIDDKNNLFFCHGCQSKGSVIDFIMISNGVDVRTALEMIGVERDTNSTAKPKAKKPAVPKATATKAEKKRDYRMNDPKFKTNEYVYRDANGNPVYKAVRYDYPDGTKSFQMIARKSDGTAVMSMKGVMRVPYRLNEIDGEEKVYIVEGEKCADALASLGLPATTTCNGSNGWIKEYAQYFAGKDLVIIPDNDDAGRKFASTIAEDCSDTARSVKIVDLFKNKEPKWDVADEIELNADNTDVVVEMLETGERSAKRFVRGVEVDISSATELNELLAHRYCEWQDGGLDITKIFPVFSGYNIRPLVGGDVLVINSATSAGKTSLVQAIALAYNEHPIAWFSLELSRTRMHERNLILSHRISSQEIERRLLAGDRLDVSALEHIHIIDKAVVDLTYIDETLSVFPLIAGEQARLVVVDYIQLMAGVRGVHGLFDKVSLNAVGLKVLAKKHNVVFCVVSQIGRKEEANLSSAKGSGAIEESATLLLGLNNVEGFKDIRRLGVYKNTNGESGAEKELGFEGQFFAFECDAQSRRTMNALDTASIEAEIEDEEETLGGGGSGCPF